MTPKPPKHGINRPVLVGLWTGGAFFAGAIIDSWVIDSLLIGMTGAFLSLLITKELDRWQDQS